MRMLVVSLGALAGLSCLSVAAPCLAAQSEHAGGAAPSDEPNEQSASEPGLLLEGVVVASDRQRSVALLRRPGAGYARAITVGETIYGFELLEVMASGIIVREGEKVLRLTLSSEWETAPITAPVEPVLAAPVEPPASMSTELQRASIEARLSQEMPRILSRTGLTPRVLEGRVRGFRITQLPGGTVLDETGIRAGDVLLSINEIALNSAYTLMDLYPRLQAEEEIRVVLERAGQTVTYVYRFN